MTAAEIAERCFQKALQVEVDDQDNARIAQVLPAADSRGVIYVAVRSDGQALKVGMTRGRLKTFWDGILDTINGKRTRKHEMQARGWWLKAVKGHTFEVWCKLPSDLVMNVECEPARTLRSYHMEEAYWAAAFRPLIGLKLSSRSKPRSA